MFDSMHVTLNFPQILTLWGPTSSYTRQCVPLHACYIAMLSVVFKKLLPFIMYCMNCLEVQLIFPLGK